RGLSMTRNTIRRRTALLSGVAAIASPSRLRAQADPIKIATLTPLTGAGGPYGPVMAKVAAAVVEEVNAAGGVLDRKVQLVSEDDQTNPDAGVRAARKLIDVDKVSAIMGTWAAAGPTAVAPLCWESKTFLCTVSGADVREDQALPLHCAGRRFDHPVAASGLPRAHPAEHHAPGDPLRRVPDLA